MNQEKFLDYLILLGDNSMILGQRLGELCGHGPELETDIALTNISLDLFGQVRNYFQLAATIENKGRTEDDLAMLRLEHEYRNSYLVEQPNTNFAHVIVRQFFYDVYHQLLLTDLMKSKNDQLRAIAEKSIKEVNYHVDFSASWLIRMGDGTEESKRKAQEAIDALWPFAMELLTETETEKWAKEMGIGADLPQMKSAFLSKVKEVIAEATLQLPEETVFQYGGKQGRHTEHMGYILAEFQYMQRAYPNMKW
tara:strand:- start:14456 stop:15211 length:756 start_codon:yes stop_codon:yes gene_type:complete